MQSLMQFGIYVYIFVLICIGLIAALVAGCGIYIGVNRLIDRYQGYVRRNRTMATSMSAKALREKRQNDAAARRLQIRVDSWARK